LPEHVVGEILDGELVVSPRPGPDNANAASVLAGALGPSFQFGDGGPGGWWILVEPELHLGEDVLVPDLAGWRRERMAELPKEAFFTAAPDWVCEVVSPNTARMDRTRKRNTYARAGVSHLWLVEPEAETLELFELETGRWVLSAVHGENEVVRASPFEAVPLKLGRLWGQASA
jgi:Uma2 family endonuclease